MNRTKDRSTANKVLVRILKKGGDTLWTFRNFSDLEALPVAAALSRLSKAGTIHRVRRGVYYHPKKTVFGESKPDPEAVTDIILKAAKVTSVAGGPNSYNRLGITSQVAGAVTRVADRRVRRTSVLGVPLKIEVRSPGALRDIEPTERAFLDTLRNLHHIPDTTPGEALLRLANLLRNKVVVFDRMVRFARHEPPRVRALLGALGEMVKTDSPQNIEEKALKGLHASLHPLSLYRLHGAAEALATRAHWNLV